MAKESCSMGELKARAFAARGFAHSQHLVTKKVAEHIALEFFYDNVISPVDTLVETYQGIFRCRIEQVEINEPQPKSMDKYLMDECDWLESNRMELSNGNDCIGALIDNLTAVYGQTLYKLSLS